MIKALKSYFLVWWKPIIAFIVPVFIFFIGVLLQQDWIIDTSLIFFFLNLIGTAISGIVQIATRNGLYIFLQYGVAIFLFYYTSIIFTYSPPDFYGVHKTIPNDIVISEPFDTIPSINDFTGYQLILANYFQPGIYLYYTNYQPCESGYFFIKAFEVNSNDALSENRISQKSRIPVEIKRDSMYSGEFTIYEGSWGDEYGARIELWYKPTNKNEFFITSRNYIVEGWMR